MLVYEASPLSPSFLGFFSFFPPLVNIKINFSAWAHTVAVAGAPQTRSE